MVEVKIKVQVMVRDIGSGRGRYVFRTITIVCLKTRVLLTLLCS